MDNIEFRNLVDELYNTNNFSGNVLRICTVRHSVYEGIV